MTQSNSLNTVCKTNTQLGQAIHLSSEMHYSRQKQLIQASESTHGTETLALLRLYGRTLCSHEGKTSQQTTLGERNKRRVEKRVGGEKRM